MVLGVCVGVGAVVGAVVGAGVLVRRRVVVVRVVGCGAVNELDTMNWLVAWLPRSPFATTVYVPAAGGA